LAVEDYLASQGFSRSGLIRQLKYEGYSVADATYAVDAIGVDWNKQAAKVAQDYLDTQGFSRSGLIVSWSTTASPRRRPPTASTRSVSDSRRPGARQLGAAATSFTHDPDRKRAERQAERRGSARSM
jgi:host cell surface-exposed lipoprotein